MKIIIILILSVLSITSSKFVNFVPYGQSNCGGDSQGVGYSITTDACITYDYNRNWEFSLSSDGNSVKWSTFNNGTGSGSMLDCSDSAGDTYSATNGQCIESIGEHYFDDSLIPKNAPRSYKVSISDSPQYNVDNKRVYVNSYMHGPGCTTSDVVFLSFATNHTSISGSKNSEYVFCAGNDPYQYYCSTYDGMPYCSNNYIYYVCQGEKQFYQADDSDINSKSDGYYTTTTCIAN